jgi:hypothetical protein
MVAPVSGKARRRRRLGGGSSPGEFRRFMLADLAKWAKVVKESGMKLD